jgi:hypothetical protein
MATVLILNIALATIVFAAILGKLTWSILTQRLDSVDGRAWSLYRTRRAARRRRFIYIPVRG